jgi:hypothetical protein
MALSSAIQWLKSICMAAVSPFKEALGQGAVADLPGV